MFAVSSHFFGRPISLHPVQPAYFDSVHRLALSNSRDATIMVSSWNLERSKRAATVSYNSFEAILTLKLRLSTGAKLPLVETKNAFHWQ